MKINLKALRPLSRIATKEVVAIELKNNACVVAHLKHTAYKKEMVNLLYRSISGTEADVAKTIRTAILELNAHNPSIAVIIPSHLIITKNIEIPTTDGQEIREIINLQAGRHTPYSREEIIVDYVAVDTYRYSYTKILLIIVARNVVKKQIDTIERTGLKVERVLLACEGIASLIPRIAKLESEAMPLAIVHVDELSSDFIVSFKHKITFVRSISIGTQHLTSAADAVSAKSRWVDEINKSLEAYQGEEIGKTPTQYILSGAIEKFDSLQLSADATLRFPLMPLVYQSHVTHSEPALKTLSAKNNVSFLNVTAALFSLEELKVELVPEEIKLRKIVEQRGRELIKTGILILSIITLVFSILMSNIFVKSLYLRKLDAKYEAVNREAKDLEKDFAKISLIRNYLFKRGYSLEVLTELYGILPEDIQLSDIRFEEQGRFSLRGTALSMSIVFSFIENLEKSNYFKDVKTKYTTKRKEESKDVTDFEISSLLERVVE